jgi:hypothetical protein
MPSKEDGFERPESLINVRGNASALIRERVEKLA